jgi:hypothetical protein
MGGLKEAEDFKSKRRAAKQRIVARLEPYENALEFPGGMQKCFLTFFQKL